MNNSRLWFTLVCFIFLLSQQSITISAEPLRAATFEVDASPPVGSPLAYDPTLETTSPLSCRGLILLPSDARPIVMCTVDWLGIANAAHEEFRERLAVAVGTTMDRVTVHVLHQHDAPRCDFSAEEILAEFGHAGKYYDERFCRDVFARAASAAAASITAAKTVTSIGIGEAEVFEVASNRRIPGEDGKVAFTRYTACKDPKIRAMPVGVIDPMLKLVSLRSSDEVVATLTFYATHPQSYYRTGQANPDFPGIARNDFESSVGNPVIHFNGAGGNIGAGKWNDGSKANRQVLADKVRNGMEAAADAQKIQPVPAGPVIWKTESVHLPISSNIVEQDLMATLNNTNATAPELRTASKHLAFLRRSAAGATVDIACLSLGDVRILFMPGELFVEYQLAAQKMAPEKTVAMAAYGEYSAGYICTEIAYSEGGYESSYGASRVSPAVEAVLMAAMRRLLQSSDNSQ